MDTIIRRLDEENIDMDVIDEASEVLKNGGLVAIPTETVYGLAGDALSGEASQKIYAAKGRPSDNPLIVHISKVEDLNKLARHVPKEAYKLADEFWPGPLTMVLPKSDIVPDSITGGLDTVAIRMPDNKITLELISKSGVYLAAPSANTSGRPSPTTAGHVEDDLAGKIDMIIDGGQVGIGIESSIIDLTGDLPVILRPGYVTKKDFEEIVGDVSIDKAILHKNADKGLAPKAPGMKYKHYAPKADMTVVLGDSEAVVSKINELVKEKISEFRVSKVSEDDRMHKADNIINLDEKEDCLKVGIIATSETKDKYTKDALVKVIGSRDNEATVANGLYNVLREFDKTEVEYIYSEGFVDDELGQAIMNRLLKAAGHKVIDLR